MIISSSLPGTPAVASFAPVTQFFGFVSYLSRTAAPCLFLVSVTQKGSHRHEPSQHSTTAASRILEFPFMTTDRLHLNMSSIGCDGDSQWYPFRPCLILPSTSYLLLLILYWPTPSPRSLQDCYTTGGLLRKSTTGNSAITLSWT